jgi:hypothetical protein
LRRAYWTGQSGRRTRVTIKTWTAKLLDISLIYFASSKVFLKWILQQENA